MKSPLMKLVGMLSWLITAFASINIGMCVAMGIDVFKTQFVMTNMPWIVVPAYYTIGVAGLISLTMFVMSVVMGCKDSGCRQTPPPPPFGA